MVAAEVNPTKFGENKTAIDKKNIIWISLLSGSGAGLACTLLCAPLDVAKVRLQIQGSLGVQKYTGSTFKVIQTIYKEEGWRGVFRGVGPAMLTVPLFWGVYWPIYDRSKLYLSEKYPTVSTPIIHLGAAVTAGVVGDVITNPFWVTRTRIQTLIMHPESKVESMSTFRMMRMIYREEGFLSLYKGLAASFLGLSHVAIQFPLYEFLKRLARDRRKGDEAVTDIIGASIVAKLVASSITYPHEVLRARMQDARGRRDILHSNHNAAHPPSITLRAMLRGIIEKEGFWSLWSGLRVSLVRIIPATVATFVSYEYISRYLKQLYKV